MGDVTFEQVQALIDQYGKYVNGSLDRIEKANLRDHEEIKAMVQRNHDEMKACLQSSEAENTEWFNDHESRLGTIEEKHSNEDAVSRWRQDWWKYFISLMGLVVGIFTILSACHVL